MGLAANIRRPGRYFRFDLTAASRGLVALQTRCALVGLKTSAGTQAALSPVQVFSGTEADTYFGVGSELALMCRAAIESAIRYGVSPQIWAVAIADPAGTAKVQTFTCSAGTATEAEEIVVTIAGTIIRAGVKVGDDEDDAAASLRAAIQEASPLLPVTAAVTDNVVSCTARQTGVGGNDITFGVIKSHPQIAVATANSVSGATAYDITEALDTLGSRDYDAIAIANHTDADRADLDAHMDAMWDPGQKRWRHSFVAETGAMATAQALATAADDYREIYVWAPGVPQTEGVIAASLAAVWSAEEDPALPFNDVELPYLSVMSDADAPSNPEIETAIAGGLTVLAPNHNGTALRIVRMVTSMVTYNGVPFFEVLDASITKSLAYTARQIDAALAVGQPRAKKTARAYREAEGISLKTLRQLEKLEIVQNVDAHAAALVAGPSPTNSDRMKVEVPTSVVPPLNQYDIGMSLIVE